MINDRGDTMDGLLTESKKRPIIALDDIKIKFFEEIVVEETHEKKEIPIEHKVEEVDFIHDVVGRTEQSESIHEVEETISSLENSIDSLTPKVPVIPEKKLEKIKDTAKIKLMKKTVREDLKNVHYDEQPELANLENTIILNADILKKDMVMEKPEKDEEKSNKRSKIIILSLFIILILFACSIPLFIRFL